MKKEWQEQKKYQRQTAAQHEKSHVVSFNEDDMRDLFILGIL
jgi:hypothetical protein